MDRDSSCPFESRRELGIHHTPMVCCNHCSFEACRTCAIRLLASLAVTAAGSALEEPVANSLIDVDADDATEAQRLSVAEQQLQDNMVCMLCKGRWSLILVPYFRWRCEGAAPRWRFTRGIVSLANAKNCAFDVQSLQQHAEKKNAEQNRDRHPPVRRAWFVAMIPNNPEQARTLRAVSAALAFPSPAKNVSPSSFASAEPTDRSYIAGRLHGATSGVIVHGTRRRVAAARRGQLKPPSEDSDSSSSTHSVPPVAGSRPQSPRQEEEQQVSGAPLCEPEYHVPSRGPCCAEGRSFLFRVANTGSPVRMCWFAVFESTTHERCRVSVPNTETAVPLACFMCPTTDCSSAGSSEAKEPASVTMLCDLSRLGVVGRYGVRRIALYECTLNGKSKALCVSSEQQPLLVISLLVSVTAMRHSELLSPLNTTLGRHISRRPVTMSSPEWARAAAAAVEALKGGRCVAMYGIGCKRHILDTVRDSLELCDFAVHLLDPWSLGASVNALGGGSSQPSSAAKAMGSALDRIILDVALHDTNHVARHQCSAASPTRPSDFILSTSAPSHVLSPNAGGSAQCSTTPQEGEGDFFDLGSSTLVSPPSGVFDLSCVDYGHSRDIVYRAVYGISRTPPRVRSLLQQGMTDASPLRHLIIVPSIDCVDDATLARLAILYESRRSTVTLLCSFDVPSFPSRCVSSEAFGFVMCEVNTLVAHVRDGLRPLPMSQRDAFTADVERSQSSTKSLGSRSKNVSLPLKDTVARALLSVPQTFRVVLAHVLARQRDVGEDVPMGVNSLIDHLSTRCQIYLTTSRMSGFVRELRSNRIIHYDGAVHAIRVLQLRLVQEVLDEVNATVAVTTSAT